MDALNRWLGRVGMATALTAVLLITAVAAGLFDPKPVGEKQQELTPDALLIPAGGEQSRRLEAFLPAGDYSVRATAVHQRGENDVGYGLRLGEAGTGFTVAVSPLGYVTIRQSAGEETAVLLPWQPWPHVRPAANELWVDVVDGRVTVRVNQELLWAGMSPPPRGGIEVWGESFGETAVITWPSLIVYSP